MFTINGITWDIPCTIEREAEIRASDVSGLMLDKSYFNDVLGTYMSYTIALAVPFGMTDKYAQIYEMITNPVEGHTFILPYNDGTVTVVGRVTNISDIYVRLANGQNFWRGIKFTVIANHPTKSKTLGETIAIGRAALPDVTDPQIGDIYEYTAGGWVPYVGE